MKRFALAIALTAAALTATSSYANPTLGLSESLDSQPAAMQHEGVQDAPDFNNQCGHWEYRTVTVPVWGYDYWGNYCIIDYRCVTQRVWVSH